MKKQKQPVLTEEQRMIERLAIKNLRTVFLDEMKEKLFDIDFIRKFFGNENICYPSYYRFEDNMEVKGEYTYQRDDTGISYLDKDFIVYLIPIDEFFLTSISKTVILQPLQICGKKLYMCI